MKDNHLLVIKAVLGCSVILLFSQLLQVYTNCCETRIYEYYRGVATRILLIVFCILLILKNKHLILSPVRRNYPFITIIILISGLLLYLGYDSHKELEAVPWYLIAVAAILVGIFEEICFRKVIFTTLIESNKGVVKSAIFSSIIFGVVHSQNAMFNEFTSELILAVASQILFALSVGMLMCGLYVKSGSIVPGIIFHSAWDYNQFVKAEATYTASVPIHEGNAVLSHLFGLMILFGIFFIGYKLVQPSLNKQRFEHQK